LKAPLPGRGRQGDGGVGALGRATSGPARPDGGAPISRY